MSQVQPSQHNTDDPGVQSEAQPQSQPLSPLQQPPYTRHISKLLKPLFFVSLGMMIGLLLGIILSVSFVKQPATTVKSQIRPTQAQAAQTLATGSTGQAYNETITDIGKPPEGTVQTDDKLRGQIVYEVPATDHSFTFQFQDSTYYANVGTWNIRV